MDPQHDPCSHQELSKATLDQDHADLYFLRTRTVLEKEKLNPPVVMEIFPRLEGILCGMCEATALLKEVAPETKVESLPEGSRMDAKEIVLRISGRYLSFGLYETALLGIL